MKYIPFYDTIDRFSIEDLLVSLRAADAPQCVYVDSPGGAFEFFSSVAPAIHRRGIVTIAGNVRSAAIILSLLGYKRQAFPDSAFFFHEVRAFVNGTDDVTVCDVEDVLEYQEEMFGKEREAFQEWLRRMKVAQGWFLGFIAEKTQLPASVFLNLMRSEATLTAREAVRYGIVHEILPEGAFQEA